MAGPPDSTSGCQSALVDKVGVSLSQYHHTMVHIADHPGMNNRPVKSAVLRCQSHPIISNLPEWLASRPGCFIPKQPLNTRLDEPHNSDDTMKMNWTCYWHIFFRDGSHITCETSLKLLSCTAHSHEIYSSLSVGDYLERQGTVQ
jgi:hypothetical protein